MQNQVIIVGRLVRDPELKTTESGRKLTNITLAVPRSFKNMQGEYDTDFLECTLWSGVAENTSEYCKVGDMLGVRGRVQSRMIEDEEGNRSKKTEIIAERVTFLTSGARHFNNKDTSTSDDE